MQSFMYVHYVCELSVQHIYIEKQCNVVYTHKVALKHDMKFIRIKSIRQNSIKESSN